MKELIDLRGKRGSEWFFGSMFRKSGKTAGATPGDMVFVGERKTEAPAATVAVYSETELSVKTVEDIDRDIPSPNGPARVWVNVVGLHDTAFVSRVGNKFNLHPLVFENIVNTNQRPKMEDYGDYVFIVAKILCADGAYGAVCAEQVCVVLGENYVISFVEHESGVFDPIRERMKNPEGRIRTRGSDYLVYAILDAVVDRYFSVLESIGEKIESFEETIEEDFAGSGFHIALRDLKREMILVRQAVWPMREVLGGLQKSEIKLVGESTGMYLRDAYDHVVQTIETVEIFREMLSSINDLYQTAVNNRTNKVMKVLTIISTIFIPLTFVAGVYGMNFEYMPELAWRWGYPLVMLFMGAAAVTMIVFFKLKKWF
jgi:magnesium transporter